MMCVFRYEVGKEKHKYQKKKKKKTRKKKKNKLQNDYFYLVNKIFEVVSNYLWNRYQKG